MAQEQRLADAWLRRHKVHNLELTPLVVARLAVRHRSELVEKRTYLGLIGVCGVGSVVEGTVFGWSEPDPAPEWKPVLFGAAYVLLTAVVGMVFWLQRRADERIAQRLRRRVTRSEAAGLAAILGGHNLRLLAVVYGGGVLIGTGSAALVAVAEDRTLALAFAFAMIVCAGLIAGLLGNVVRRPAIADDEPSLAADDLLRRMDSGRALFPYPVVLAAVAAASAGGSVLLWVFLVYAVAAVLTWAYTTRPAKPTGVTPGAWT